MNFVIGLLLSLSSAYALACQPPPVNYFELGNLNAIVNSQDVRTKMTGSSIKGIQQIEGQMQKYVVEAESCSLEVEVQVKQVNPDFPCGGPYTFTAVVPSSATCE